MERPGHRSRGPSTPTPRSTSRPSQEDGPVVSPRRPNAHVAFGRDESFYIESATHDSTNAAGVIDLQRFDFRTNTPVQNLTNSVVYSWDTADAKGADEALRPTLAVDDNLPTFSDTNATGQTVTQTDPDAGNVYIAWASTNQNSDPGIPDFNPNTIRMVASSNEGTTFSNPVGVNDSSNPNVGGGFNGAGRYVEPSIAISQGRASRHEWPQRSGVPGGQVTIVYDDYGTLPSEGIGPYDRILDQTDLVGGTGDVFAGQSNMSLVSGSASDPINVNITDPKFTTLSSLEVSLSIAWPTADELEAILVPPTAVNTYLKTQNPDYPGFITLFDDDLMGANPGETTGGGASTAGGGDDPRCERHPVARGPRRSRPLRGPLPA